MTPVLTVENLEIGFGREASVVRDVSFEVPRGETLALVGESGSGKTITCRSVLRILPRSAQLRSGRIMLNGRDGPVELSRLSERQMRHVRGDAISMNLGTEWRIDVSDKLIEELHRLFGVPNVHFNYDPNRLQAPAQKQQDRAA